MNPLTHLATALADRYRIERELGAGGMATVYLAQDLRHDRKVALKVLKPELAAVLGAERFVVEIKTTAALQHPHILPLFDSGTADGFLYYVMPFIDGETLRSKLDRETQLGIEEAIRITSQVADALDYAHRHGVIHRDIKPENILLHDGRPMVADFGIALALSAAAGGRMTETGLSLGTPHYMSPEQATAEKELTNRSDIYSLGSVLYEMLTGNPPHVGASAQQIIMKIVTDEARPVTELRKSVPPNVAAAVGKALEKLPADRFESAKDFGDALTNPAFATTGITTVRTGKRTSHWQAALAVGLLLGIVTGAAGARLLFRTADAVEQRREQLTFNGQAKRPAISPAGDYVSYVQVSCEHGQTGGCRSSLMLQEPGSTQPRVLISDALLLDAPRWTHDGRTVVVGGQLDEAREGLFAVPRLSGTAQLIGPRGAYDTHPSADSVLLVPPRDAGAGVGLVISLADAAVVDSIRLPFASASEISWAPDGRHVAASTGGGLQIVDRRGRSTASLTTSNRPALRWTVDGKGLLFFRTGPVKEDAFIRIPVDRDGRIVGPPEVVLDRVQTLYRGEFDVARGTGRMVFATGDAITDIWSFDMTARAVPGRRETSGTTWYGQPELSHDGRRLYYYRGDALGDNVYVLDRAMGRETALTAQHLPGGNALRLSADGRRLAYVHKSESTPRLEYLEFPSGRAAGGSAEIDDDVVVPVPPRGFLARSSAGSLTALDSLGGAWHVLPIPDSLLVSRFDVSPDGTKAAFVAATSRASVETNSTDRTMVGRRTLLVGVVALTGDEVRIVGALDPAEQTPGLTWSRDGAVYMGRWLPTDGMPSVWRLSLDTRRLSRVVDLPAACTPESIRISAEGRASACTVHDFRSDIWLLDIAGVTR
jgi:hypothetical protein